MLKPISHRRQPWTLHQWIRFVAGGMVLISLLLSLTHASWLFLTAFVGVNLLQSAFTNWCPLIVLLKKMGVKEG